MLHVTRFKIAGLIFRIASQYPRVFKDGREFLKRYEAFFYRGRKNDDIKIAVEVVRSFPVVAGREVFAVHEPGSGFERWRLWENKDGYVFHCPMSDREVMAWFNKDFSAARAYTLVYKGGFVWDLRDIVYDLMQIMLINHFACRKRGLILHAAGIKENGQALVFAGKSEGGKSTTARLWHKYTKAVVLNDDRIILRKTKKGYQAYSGPWSGEFGHERRAVSDQAGLNALFIIEHAKKNYCRRLSGSPAFRFLYPVLFPVFWHRKLMENNLELCQDLMKKVPVFRLGFVKNKKVISFVRGIVGQKVQL
jgi:hypothetical protein